MPNKRAKHAAGNARCSICGRTAPISFDLLHCCERCQDAVVEAEDAGGHWRTAYLCNGRLIECEGEQMRTLCAHLLPQPCYGGILDGGLEATVESAVSLLRSAPRVVVLLGSGASAGYGIPINLASSSETDPLKRYGPVRQAVLSLGEDELGGLYDQLRQLLLAIRPRAHMEDGRLIDASTAVISTNIDDLATRAGLTELQLHGSTGRLQCAPCGLTWLAGREWPPANCPACGQRPICNLPTNTLDEEDVVWRWIHEAHREAREFLDGAAGAPLAVLALGVATHVHTLTPELQLVIEARTACGDATSVVWANLHGHGGALPGAMELTGDAVETVAQMLGHASS